MLSDAPTAVVVGALLVGLLVGLLAAGAALGWATGRTWPRPGTTDDVDGAAVLPRGTVAALAHELRSPLTAAVGHLDLLTLDPGLTREQRSAVTSATAATERAARLLETFLEDPSGWGPGVRVAGADVVDLDLLLRDALDDFAPLATRRGVSIAYDASPGATVAGDGRGLRQVIDNLLSNALKYNETHGWVDVRLRVTRDEGDLATVVEVVNPGVTLDEDEVAHAFEPDVRGRRATQTAPGHGIGLAVTRRIVRAHGGEVSLRASQETGTTAVRVALPSAGTPAG